MIGGRLLMIAMLQFGAWQLRAQTNLVPNPSFEQNVGCPTTNGQIQLAVPWVKVGGDGLVPYYNDCGTTSYQSQSNQIGIGGARTGVGMAALILTWANYCLPFYAEGNFIGSQLNSPLINGKTYRIRFFLSLSDYHRYATRNVGAYLSTGQPPNSTSILLSLIPQVRYTGEFLTDKVGWMKIEGEFTAVGGENFLTIGNFDGYANSDTLNLNDGGTAPSICYWSHPTYYIDDVSVTEVDTTVRFPEAEEVKEPAEVVGVEEQEVGKFGAFTASVYPNPANDNLIISINDFEIAVWRFEVISPIGQLVSNHKLQSGMNQIDTIGILAGAYYWRLFRNNQNVQSDKIIFIK